MISVNIATALLNYVSLTLCSLDELSNKVDLIEGQQQY